MGLRLGWVIIRGGTDSLGSSQTSGQAGYCLSPNRFCNIGEKWATSVQQTCPSGVTCLPMLGNVLAPSGHAACPKLVKNPYKNETFEIRNNQHPPLVYPGLSLDVFYEASGVYLGFCS